MSREILFFFSIVYRYCFFSVLLEVLVRTNIKAKENYSSQNSLDRYALLKTKELIEKIDSNLSNYDITSACQSVPEFIDAINNWYIRRSRPRFWKHADDNDSKNAYDTLYTVLLNVTKALSPLIPLIAEDTTITLYFFFIYEIIIFDTFSIFCKLPTEVPPNFKTIIFIDNFILIFIYR